MTTTIKVAKELRDRLRREADLDELTLGQLLEALLDERARMRRFEAMRTAMAATEPGAYTSWRDETAAWDATLIDGLEPRK